MFFIVVWCGVVYCCVLWCSRYSNNKSGTRQPNSVARSILFNSLWMLFELDTCQECISVDDLKNLRYLERVMKVFIRVEGK